MTDNNEQLTVDETTGLPIYCDHGYHSGRLCDRQPVTFYALAGYSPEQSCEDDIDRAFLNLMFDRPAASLGGYCCLEHAMADPRPALADAKRVYAMVLEQMPNTVMALVWCQLIDAYPTPVQAAMA